MTDKKTTSEAQPGSIKIIVATHKNYLIPEDKIYLPVQAGAAVAKENLPYQSDAKGKNISEKNPNYCELTALYWAWQNLDADYLGLVHYRRHFARTSLRGESKEEKLAHVLSEEEVRSLLKQSDIILPRKRNYYIENLYDHFAHTMFEEPLKVAGEVIAEKFPEYKEEFENLKTRRSAHMFNMFIMKREIIDEYCAWLFAILEEVERRVDFTKYDTFHARSLGRVSELLLDVFLFAKRYNYIEVHAVDIEPINWLKKGFAFLAAKFTGKKYGKSF